MFHLFLYVETWSSMSCTYFLKFILTTDCRNHPSCIVASLISGMFAALNMLQHFLEPDTYF